MKRQVFIWKLAGVCSGDLSTKLWPSIKCGETNSNKTLGPQSSLTPTDLLHHLGPLVDREGVDEEMGGGPGKQCLGETTAVAPSARER